MSTIFYDHLVPWDDVRSSLAEFGFTEDEVHTILLEFDKVLHIQLFTHILSKLPHHVHEDFIQGFSQDPAHPMHLELVAKFDPHFEGALKREVDTISESMIQARRSMVK